MGLSLQPSSAGSQKSHESEEPKNFSILANIFLPHLRMPKSQDFKWLLALPTEEVPKILHDQEPHTFKLEPVAAFSLMQ